MTCVRARILLADQLTADSPGAAIGPDADSWCCFASRGCSGRSGGGTPPTLLRAGKVNRRRWALLEECMGGIPSTISGLIGGLP